MSYILRTNILRYYHPTSNLVAFWHITILPLVRCPSNFRVTFIHPPFDIYLSLFIPIITPYYQTVHYFRSLWLEFLLVQNFGAWDNTMSSDHWFLKRVGNNSCTKKSKHVMDCPRTSSEMSHPCPHITSNLLVWRIHLARESHLTLGCQWNWKFKCNTMMMTCNPIAGLIGINHLPLFPCQWTWTFHPPY